VACQDVHAVHAIRGELIVIGRIYGVFDVSASSADEICRRPRPAFAQKGCAATAFALADSLKVLPMRFLSIGADGFGGRSWLRDETIYSDGLSRLGGLSPAW
jgi:hypothetical protein